MARVVFWWMLMLCWYLLNRIWRKVTLLHFQKREGANIMQESCCYRKSFYESCEKLRQWAREWGITGRVIINWECSLRLSGQSSVCSSACLFPLINFICTNKAMITKTLEVSSTLFHLRKLQRAGAVPGIFHHCWAHIQMAAISTMCWGTQLVLYHFPLFLHLCLYFSFFFFLMN